MYRLRLIAAWCALFCTMRSLLPGAYGQVYDYNNLYFRQFYIQHGMLSGRCSKMYKDNYGFLWISNYYGVSIFNGNQFINITSYSDRDNYYLGDFPHDFVQLDKNRMLITCSNGIYVYSYRNNSITKVQNLPPVKHNDRISIIGKNKAVSKTLLKIGSDIYCFSDSLKYTLLFSCTDEDKEVEVKCIGTDAALFYYTHSSYLVYCNIQSNVKDTLMYLPHAGDGIIINGQKSDRYVIASSAGIIQVSKKTKSLLKKSVFPLQANNNIFLPNCNVMDKNGNFWIGGSIGLYIYFPATNTVNIAYGASPNPLVAKLEYNVINDILIDDDNLFISTDNAGVILYDKSFAFFKNYPLPLTVNSIVLSLVVQGDDLLYTVNTGGLMRFPLNWPLSKSNFYPVAGQYGDILQLENLDDSHVWAIFREQFKLAVINTKTFKTDKTIFEIDSISNAYYHAINFKFLDLDRRPIIKRIRNDFFYYSVGNLLFSVTGNIRAGFHFNFIDSIRTTSCISSINRIGSGDILIGTGNFELYKLEENKLISLKKERSLSQLPVRSVLEDNHNRTYLLTANGVYVYDKGFKFPGAYWTKANRNMLSNILYAGEIDKRNILWMSTNGGIMAYDISTDRLYNFSTSNPIVNMEFNIKSIGTDPVGNIYFGGSHGVTSINTNLFKVDSMTGYPYFREIRNLNSILHEGLLPGSIAEKKSFSYNRNTFRFSVQSVSYGQAGNIQFRYKLEGFDSAWSIPNADNTITYINLPPGEYRLRVSQVYSGHEYSPEIFYSFNINKPFWKTTSFIVLAVLFSTGILFMIVRYFMRKKIEQQRIEMSKQIALKNERERISQELHDDLGSGLTSIRLLAKTILAKENPPSSSPMLDNIGRISGELIDQMSEIIWVLNHTDDTVNGLLAHLRVYMSDYLQRTDVGLQLRFINRIREDCNITGVQRRNVLLIVKEVFHNVVKHARAANFIITSSDTDSTILITMQDDGVGIQQKGLTQGNGIGNIKKRMSVINGKIQFENRIGTTVIIEFPKQVNI